MLYAIRTSDVARCKFAAWRNSMRSRCVLKLRAVHFCAFTKHTDVMSAVCTVHAHA